jgi:hypothetical protein
MDIKDAISIYTFLGQLGWLGSIAFSVFIALIAAYFSVKVTEKITNKQDNARLITIAVSVLMLGCMITLSIMSIIRKDWIDKANNIKSYMISGKRNWSGYKEIARGANLSITELALGQSDTGLSERVKEIVRITGNFPEEFEISPIQNRDSTDTVGVELIDTTAARILSKYYEDLIPMIVAKITYYAKSHPGQDSISYGEIRSKIDDRFQDYVLDMAVSRNVLQFIPVNMTSNGYIDSGIKFNFNDSVAKLPMTGKR